MFKPDGQLLFNTFREMWVHEDNQINQRTGWGLATQTLLAVLSMELYKKDTLYTIPILIIASLTAMITLYTIHLASISHVKLQEKYALNAANIYSDEECIKCISETYPMTCKNGKCAVCPTLLLIPLSRDKTKGHLATKAIFMVVAIVNLATVVMLL